MQTDPNWAVTKYRTEPCRTVPYRTVPCIGKAPLQTFCVPTADLPLTDLFLFDLNCSWMKQFCSPKLPLQDSESLLYQANENLRAQVARVERGRLCIVRTDRWPLRLNKGWVIAVAKSLYECSCFPSPRNLSNFSLPWRDGSRKIAL